MTIVRKSNDEIRAAKGRIDVEKLESATEEDIERWNREDGIDEAALGPPRYVRVGPDVRLVRERLGLSQEAFAARYHLSLRTVQEWEQRRRVPEGPARVLLQVIEREPEAAARALGSPAASCDATR
ncbi:MAG TPA: helix-turn-helix domain-containing protein [Chloroflexota bacterium]